MEQIIVKVYGHVSPASEGMLDAVRPIADDAVALEGTMLLVSFEGMYFMIEEFMEALAPHLARGCEGRIDYIEMDAWTLTRFWIKDGLVSSSSASLNQVMAYSGH